MGCPIVRLGTLLYRTNGTLLFSALDTTHRARYRNDNINCICWFIIFIKLTFIIIYKLNVNSYMSLLQSNFNNLRIISILSAADVKKLLYFDQAVVL